MEIRWIKIRTDMFDHRKIKQIEMLPDGDSIIVIWVKLLCLAGATNNGGLIYLTRDIPYTDEMLANEFRRPVNTVRLALQTFETLGMIEKLEDIYAVANWEKYQSIEGMEKVREQNRIRKQNQRERERLALECHVTVTGRHGTDKEKEIEKEKENIYNGAPDEPNATPKWVKPTVEMIAEYAREKGYNIDAQAFYDHYESNGWMVGKTHMRKWKAAVANWARSDYNKPKWQSKERGSRFG